MCHKLGFCECSVLRACAFGMFIYNLSSVVFTTTTIIIIIIITIFIIAMANSGTDFHVYCLIRP